MPRNANGYSQYERGYVYHVRCSALEKGRFMLSALARNQIDISVGKTWTRALTEHGSKIELGQMLAATKFPRSDGE